MNYNLQISVTGDVCAFSLVHDSKEVFSGEVPLALMNPTLCLAIEKISWETGPKTLAGNGIRGVARPDWIDEVI